eukprot:3800159-Pyramimonas_sp.AAC.1
MAAPGLHLFQFSVNSGSAVAQLSCFPCSTLDDAPHLLLNYWLLRQRDSSQYCEGLAVVTAEIERGSQRRLGGKESKRKASPREGCSPTWGSHIPQEMGKPPHGQGRRISTQCTRICGMLFVYVAPLVFKCATSLICAAVLYTMAP